MDTVRETTSNSRGADVSARKLYDHIRVDSTRVVSGTPQQNMLAGQILKKTRDGKRYELQ